MYPDGKAWHGSRRLKDKVPYLVEVVVLHGRSEYFVPERLQQEKMYFGQASCLCMIPSLTFKIEY